MVNNIDVTLRDGGYLNNFNFTTEYAIKHVEAFGSLFPEQVAQMFYRLANISRSRDIK
ncbi:hypothetical protein [Photorhabdus thracensis]|uniref:hypothetical protein n=1 Tax=Photorhabdus thracensis TaxID=230089 RepID=UPI000B1DCB0A|nr:hypothetical protein [Photorhabdus thracensis]MCC8423178.1 hypothetical protein [Photorhabdus thracensis]